MREIEAWLVRNPDVSKWRFSVALRASRSCLRNIRTVARVSQATVDRARRIMAEKPAEVLRQPNKRSVTPKADQSVINARRAQSLKATNRRKAMERIAAGLSADKASISMRITQRQVEQQMREAARMADPIEKAKLALRRAGFIVYSLSIYGGPADLFHVSGRGREEISANDLIALAEQSGRWAA